MNRLAFVFLIVIAATLAACGSIKPTPIPKAQISLTATDIAYDTNRLEAKVGQSVVVTLHNEGVLEHDFSIMNMPVIGEVIAQEGESEMGHDMSNMTMDPEVHVASPVGESLTVEFTPSMPGEYEFFCTVEGHKEAGMVGTLVVTAP